MRRLQGCGCGNGRKLEGKEGRELVSMLYKVHMKKVAKNNCLFTEIKLGKKVTGKIRRLIETYCAANPEKYKHTKSSRFLDYYLFQGDHLRLMFL